MAELLERIDRSHVLHDHELLLKRAVTCLSAVQFDTIVVVGVSGMLAAPIIAQHFGVHVLVLRKPFEFSGSKFDEEGVLGGRWVFVDDLFDSGRTFRDCYSRVAKLASDNGHESEFIGAFAYSAHIDRGKFYPAGDPVLSTLVGEATWS